MTVRTPGINRRYLRLGGSAPYRCNSFRWWTKGPSRQLRRDGPKNDLLFAAASAGAAAAGGAILAYAFIRAARFIAAFATAAGTPLAAAGCLVHSPGGNRRDGCEGKDQNRNKLQHNASKNFKNYENEDSIDAKHLRGGARSAKQQGMQPKQGRGRPIE